MNSPLEKLEVFPWNENLDTGIAVIDAQHRKLVSLLNQLAATLTRGSLLETNDIFTKLTQYAEFHFETEEAIWAEHLGDDSWLSSHQLSHSSFLPKVLELKESEAIRSHTEVIESIILFLIRWLAFHILDSDKRMAFFIQHRHAGLSFDDAKIASDKKMSGSIRLVIETVMHMYDSLSSTTLELMRESHKRLAIEKELHKANKQLLKANLRLEALAITDQLTDLYNRRHFNNVFARELKRAKRDKAPLALIMLDIDHFKKINDQLGHSAGDRVLIQVGQKLKEICHRPGDFPFRLGGEEFCILAANLDHKVLRNLRRSSEKKSKI
jgi:hemerythrin-like metal-binding protein